MGAGTGSKSAAEAHRGPTRCNSIDAKKLESVGREMIQEMRDEAKARLIDSIEKPIKRRCESFVKKNFHIGPGVKQRILELYGSMAEEVSEAAKEPAASILQKLFKMWNERYSTPSKNTKTHLMS